MYPQINLSTQGDELVFLHQTAVTAGQQTMVVKMFRNMCYNLVEKLELSISHSSHNFKVYIRYYLYQFCLTSLAHSGLK